jgi:hypothetical protein
LVKLLELLNKVWDLGLLEILLVRRNCFGRFGFGGSTVLLGFATSQCRVSPLRDGRYKVVECFLVNRIYVNTTRGLVWCTNIDAR